MAKLYLLPSGLGENDVDRVVPAFNKELIMNVRYFTCENLRSARRFLISCGLPSPISQDIQFIELRNDDDEEGFQESTAILKEGNDLVFLSEAGNPCVADPGERLVSFAHQNKIQVVPLVGASSILLALIASGFNAEHFSFNGYIPRDPNGRIQCLKEMIQQAQKNITQIFMETPYRNNQVLDDLLKLPFGNVKLCIAANLCCENEMIISGDQSMIRSKITDLHKQPCMFVLGL